MRYLRLFSDNASLVAAESDFVKPCVAYDGTNVVYKHVEKTTTA